MCSVGDCDRSAVIQIELWIFNTGFDIRNAYHKRVITFKMANINVILRRIFGDIIGVAIGINDYTIESVISNAIGQGIIEANSVLIIVIVSTAIVFAFGQGSDQPELELFVDRMVSGTAPTVIVTRRASIVVVVDFLLNSGLYNLRRNLNVIVVFVNLQQEGIVGMIGIALAKGASINDQIITCLIKFEATGVTTLKDGVRVCIGIRVDIVAYKTRESDAVIIGIMPFADSRNSFLRSEISFKLTADGRIFRQFLQKILRMRDVFAPRNVGNLKAISIITRNITIEDLEGVVLVFCVEVLLSVVCKRRDRHGAHHGNCQQCGQQLFDCFLHHDLRKSPFKFF